MEPQREWFEKDYYSILGVSEKASDSEVTKAYRKLAKKYHPDANPGDRKAEDRFKEAASAYDVLGDAKKRKAYDEVRRLGPMAGGFGPGAASSGGFGPGGFRFDFGSGRGTDQHGGDLGDLLSGLFGGHRRRSGSHRGEDLEAELALSFTEAVYGTTAKVPVVSNAACEKCSGSGAAPGTQLSSCEKCDGRGTVDQNQGLFSFSRPCSGCGGRGQIVQTPCTSCSGRGLQRRHRKVAARIPAGVKNGQRIRLKRRGAPGVPGGEPGDLFVRLRVRPHRFFERDGRNLALTVPVSLAEAALGADVRVPTPDGAPVTIRIPQGTASGTKMRVGLGSAGTPDLIVTVEVQVPQQLSDAQRSAMEAFAAATHQNPRAHLEA